MKIIVATNNKSKLKEIREILKGVEIISQEEAGIEIDVDENAETFEGNALIKARGIYKLTKSACIADDSGLCIEYLDGFPGVKTKRFLGENASNEDRNDYYIEKLKGLPKEKRKAKVVTAIAYIDEDGNESVYIGELNGYIAEEQRGENGFAFDKVVELDNGKTIAELSAEEKNKISSRNIALQKLYKKLLSCTKSLK